ncbi:MAG: hypothetical protein M3397_11465 [Actinomycetota bacterium]|jgi:hypothetical protein|nr:hypothetical protein [Actinomycetota bacterium]
MFKSVTAVLLGALISLAIGLLVVFGIVAPLFTSFVSPSLARASALPAGVLVCAVAFSFYFGGMAAGYRAPSRRLLHGVLVVPVLFALSPALNFVAGQNPFPQFHAPGTALLSAALFVVAAAAAYVGARRGEGLYAHNRSHLRRQRSR